MNSSREIIFIDSLVFDYDSLISQFPVDAEIHVLNTTQNGLTQIAAALNGRSNIDAIHIISHGSEGELNFANGVLNNENLSTYQSQLKQIGAALSKDGDILLYGCNVASGENSNAFIDSLAKLTQADVAASTDLTGASTKGGDWVLENHTGEIEAQSLTIENWLHTLGWENVGTAGFSAGTASYTDLEFDTHGTPYVVYRGDLGDSSKATVMKFNGTSWEGVGTAGFSVGAASDTDLEFDTHGTPYVVYWDNGNANKATVMKFNGTSWEGVGTAGFSAGSADDTDLAFHNGTPYVVYEDFGNAAKATVMKFNGTSWEGVGAAGFSTRAAEYTNLAFDTHGTPYVVYQDFGNAAKATVMKFNGTSWEGVGAAGFSTGAAKYTNLAFDTHGTPYVVYRDGANANKATVMKFNGTSWEGVGAAGFSAGSANDTDLAFDTNGIPYVVYQDSGNASKATVMQFNGTSWAGVGTAGFSAGMASKTDLAFDTNGIPYVVYRDAGNASKATVMRYVESLNLLAESDSGSSSTDNITNVTTPTIRVSFNGGAEGNTVELKLGSTVIGTHTLTAGEATAGSADVTVTTPLSVQGANVITATLASSLLSGNLTITLDTTAPTAITTATSINNTTNAVVVQSNETGIAYLVKDSVTVTNLASITGATDNEFNSVAIRSANIDTNLATTGLVDGTYQVYAVDVAGNLSAVATVDTTSPTDIALSNANFNVLGGSDAIVGALSSTDVIGTTFTYSLVAGGGDTNNALFNIDSGNLRVTTASALTAGQTYSVRVRTTDAAGNTFDEPFTITAISNNLPTFTTLPNISTAFDSTPRTISFFYLKHKGNQADSDGTVDAFVVKEVTTGTLTIGATPFDASTNAIIDATHIAYWTPDILIPAGGSNFDSSGNSFVLTDGAGVIDTLDAFTIVAKDNNGAVSDTPVQVKVDVEQKYNAPKVTDVAPVLAAIDEDTTQPLGQSVSDLFLASFSDSADELNANDFAGVIISDIPDTTGKGTWQVKLAGEQNSWQPLALPTTEIYTTAPQPTDMMQFSVKVGTTDVWNTGAGRLSTRYYEGESQLIMSSTGQNLLYLDGIPSLSSAGYGTDDLWYYGYILPLGWNTPTGGAKFRNVEVTMTITFSQPVTTVLGGLIADNEAVGGTFDGNTYTVRFTPTGFVPNAFSSGIIYIPWDKEDGELKITDFSISYSGKTWNLTTKAPASGMFVPADAMLRFVPDANYHGVVPALTTKLVDTKTDGSSPFLALAGLNAAEMTYSLRGHVSEATLLLTSSVNSVNDITLSDVPNTAQAVTTGQSAALADFTVADEGSPNLTITLTATNGSVGGVTDADANVAGIQVTGTAATINTALAAATFTANSAGNASIAISVTDGIVGTPTTTTYNLTATNPPPPPADPEPTPPPAPAPVVETPKIETKPVPVVEKPVSRDVEMQVPSASGVKGDRNGDGIADVDQKHVISLPTQKDLRETGDTPKVFLSIELPTGQTLTKAEVKSVAEMTKDKPITFATETIDAKGQTVITETAITEETAPFGLFEFNFAGVPTTTDTTTGVIKGGTTDVKLYLDDNQTVEKYLKQTVSGTWEPIPFSYVYDEKLGKTVVSISLTDGDKFDLDGKVDGGINDPGTPIITPKLTAAPEPVVVEILQKPTTKVFVGYDRTFSLDSGTAQFFGQGEREVVELGANASNAIIDQNIEQVRFPGVQSDYSFEQKGNSLQVAKGSVMITQITVQDDANGSLFSFENGTQSAKFAAGVV